MTRLTIFAGSARPQATAHGFMSVVWELVRGLRTRGFDVELQPIDASIRRRRGLVVGDLGALVMMADSVDELYGYVVVEGPVTRMVDKVEQALLKASGVAVPSEFVASELVRFRRDVRVIPHGVRPCQATSEKEFDLGIVVSYPHFHRAIALRKGVDYYMRVLESTSHSVIATYGLVHLAGYIDRQRREWLLNRLNAIVPPRSDPRIIYRKARVLLWLSRCEGFGLPPLEAMACGTPVVFTDAPAHNQHSCCYPVRTRLNGVIRMPSSGVYRYVPYDPYNYEIEDMGELLRVIDYAVEHHSEYSERVREIASRYTVDAMVDGIAELISRH